MVDLASVLKPVRVKEAESFVAVGGTPADAPVDETSSIGIDGEDIVAADVVDGTAVEVSHAEVAVAVKSVSWGGEISIEVLEGWQKSD